MNINPETLSLLYIVAMLRVNVDIEKGKQAEKTSG